MRTRDRTPLALGLFSVCVKATTCDVSRPMMPALSGAGSSPRTAKGRTSASSTAPAASGAKSGEDMMRSSAERRRLTRGALAAEGDGVAALVVAHARQIVSHEKQAASTGALAVLRCQRIGHALGIESRPLILDHGKHLLGGDVIVDADHETRIATVAVLDGVDERFFQGQVHAEDVLVRVALFGHRGCHQLDDLIDLRRRLNAEAQRWARENTRRWCNPCRSVEFWMEGRRAMWMDMAQVVTPFGRSLPAPHH